MKEKDIIINEIKQFMYDEKLSDLNVHSRQYLSSVIFSEYENNAQIKQPYTVIYGDYNKLNEINKKYGDKMGDRAIQTATRIIKETMPENAKISRVGGDEFLVIVDGILEEEAEKYIKQVEENLNSTKNRPYNLTMEMAAIDSTKTKGINEMYEKVEKLANSRKNKAREKTEGTKEEILSHKIEKSIQNYLSFFRFPKDFNFENEYTKDILKKTIQTSINMVQKKQHIKSEEVLNLNTPVISQDKASKIDKLLKYGKNEKSIKDSDLKTVYNSLIREPVSKQLSRRYFEHYIQQNKTNQLTNISKPNGMEFVKKFFLKMKEKFKPTEEIKSKEFKMIFITTSFMKLSNSEKGHSKTDQSLKEIPNQIKENLSQYIQFTEDVTNKDNSNMILDVGAGNFLVIYDKDIEIENSKLNEAIKKANENIDTLKISAYKTKETVSLDEMSTFINMADKSEQLKNEKTKLKLEKFLKPETQKALDIALEEPINYYVKNFKDSDSIEAKMNFTEMITLGVSKAVFNEFEMQQDHENDKQNDIDINNLKTNRIEYRKNTKEENYEER